MIHGLKRETVSLILSVFKKHDEIDEAILYGSRAIGNPKNGSDIDVTLKGKDLNLRLINRINNELDDLLLPYRMDISIYHQITNTELIDHIERVGIIIYKKGNKDRTD